MAKRSRGSVRPGQRRPGQRQPVRPTRPAAAPRPSDGLTDAELARAAELEAGLVAEERAAEAAQRRSRDRTRGRTIEDEVVPRGRSREGTLLGSRAQEEYAYVVRDVRRIALVGGSLLGVLAVLFVLIEVAGVIRV